MPAQIETAGFCPQYFAQFEVAGSKGNTYLVSLNGAESVPHCTCPAFKYSGGFGEQDCKHIRLVWAHGCLANPQWKDPGPNDLADHGVTIAAVDTQRQYPEKCPGCGEDCIAVRIAV